MTNSQAYAQTYVKKVCPLTRFMTLENTMLWVKSDKISICMEGYGAVPKYMQEDKPN